MPLSNESYRAHLQAMTRRHFFNHSARGLGTLALASLLNPNLFASGKNTPGASSAPGFPSRGVIDPPHFAPKAKRVIYLFQSGAPSQLDLYDYKPKLIDLNGKPMPESYTKEAMQNKLNNWRAGVLTAGEARERSISADLRLTSNDASSQKNQRKCSSYFA
jgi:hypothetical protein